MPSNTAALPCRAVPCHCALPWDAHKSWDLRAWHSPLFPKFMSNSKRKWVGRGTENNKLPDRTTVIKHTHTQTHTPSPTLTLPQQTPGHQLAQGLGERGDWGGSKKRESPLLQNNLFCPKPPGSYGILKKSVLSCLKLWQLNSMR